MTKSALKRYWLLLDTSNYQKSQDFQKQKLWLKRTPLGFHMLVCWRLGWRVRSGEGRAALSLVWVRWSPLHEDRTAGPSTSPWGTCRPSRASCSFSHACTHLVHHCLALPSIRYSPRSWAWVANVRERHSPCQQTNTQTTFRERSAPGFINK